MISEGTTTTNLSVPYVILTFKADALSMLLVDPAVMVDPAVEGTPLRVPEVEADDAEEGVSGMEEKAVVNVEVPVVGREDTGEIGERGVTGDSDSWSLRPAGSGGIASLPRCKFV